MLQSAPVKSKSCSDEEISQKLKELREKKSWFQVTIRGAKGIIKELVVSETKVFDDHQ